MRTFAKSFSIAAVISAVLGIGFANSAYAGHAGGLPSQLAESSVAGGGDPYSIDCHPLRCRPW